MPQFSEFTFPSSTGTNTIYVRMCEPDGEPRGIVQIAHGIAEHIGRYEEFMSFLASNGFIAVGNDHLGHGRTAQTPEEKGIFCENDGWERVVDDMDKLHDIIAEKHPGLPYIFFGHSMGSFLTRTYLIKHPDKPDAAVICGTGHVPKTVSAGGLAAAETLVRVKGVRADGTSLNALAFGSYNKKIEEPRTVFDWLSSDPDVVNKYIEDPLCGFIPTAGLFRDMMSGIRFITSTANIALMDKETPIFFISGWDDPVGEYGNGVIRAFKAFTDAGMKHVRIKLYPGARHELLNEFIRKYVMNDILGRIENTAKKQQA